MPRIAEIKTVSGELWVKVELTLGANPSEPITLWTDSEMKYHERALAMKIVRTLQDIVDTDFPYPK